MDTRHSHGKLDRVCILPQSSTENTFHQWHRNLNVAMIPTDCMVMRRDMMTSAKARKKREISAVTDSHLMHRGTAIGLAGLSALSTQTPCDVR